MRLQRLRDAEHLVGLGQTTRDRLALGTRVRRRLGRGEPEGAGGKGLDDQLAHAVDLFVLGRPLGGLVAQDIEAQRRVPDHGGHIQPRGRRLDGVEVLGEALEAPGDARLERLHGHALDVLEGAGDRRPVLRPGRGDAEAAVAHDDRRDAVPARRGQVAVPQHLSVVVRVDVDESGRQHQPVEVDLGGAVRRHVADGGDATVLDADVGSSGRGTGAVDQLRAPQNQIHQSSLHFTPVRAT